MTMQSLEPIQDTQYPQLDMDSIVSFLTLTNNEVRCLALACLKTNVYVPETEVYDSIILGSKRLAANPPIKRWDFGSTIALNPSSVVVTRHEPGKERNFKRTETGELAAALGGHLLNLSKISNFPISAVLGEHTPLRRVKDKKQFIDSYESRLIVLQGLYTMAANNWQRSGRLYEYYDKNGLNKRTANNHIKQLENNNIVERRVRSNPKGGRIFEQKLVEDGYFKPNELVEKFLTVIGRFAIHDSEFIKEGLQYGKAITNDKVYLPGLVQRTLYNSSHYKQTTNK